MKIDCLFTAAIQLFAISFFNLPTLRSGSLLPVLVGRLMHRETERGSRWQCSPYHRRQRARLGGAAGAGAFLWSPWMSRQCWCWCYWQSPSAVDPRKRLSATRTGWCACSSMSSDIGNARLSTCVCICILPPGRSIDRSIDRAV